MNYIIIMNKSIKWHHKCHVVWRTCFFSHNYVIYKIVNSLNILCRGIQSEKGIVTFKIRCAIGFLLSVDSFILHEKEQES